MRKQLFLIIVLFLTPSFLVKAQSDAPFLYYYERESNRFLIERADGQDRFVLVEDALLEDHELRAQGWSPSGHWFMWMASKSVDTPHASYQNFRAWVVSNDGTKTLTLLDDLDWTVTVAWSPVTDFLLVTRFEEIPVDGSGLLTLYVIDMDTQQVIMRTEMGESQGYSHTRWSDDGSHIFYRPMEEIIRVAVPTGKMDTIPYMPRSKSDRYGLRYDHENHIVAVTDLGGNSLFEKPLPGVGVTYFEWNPQNTHALIFVSQGYMGPKHDPSPPHDVWLLSMADQSLIHIIDNAAIPTVEPYGMSYADYPLSIWTPEGNRALFPTRHRLLYWFNLDNSTIENTGLPVLPLSDIEELYKLYTELGTQWTEHYGFIMWGEDIWVYDRQTDQFLDTSFGIHENFGVSSDERYIAQPGGCGLPGQHAGFCVWDWERNTATLLSPNGMSIDWWNRYHTEVIWHTTSPWVLLQWVGYWIVSNPDGTLQRDISYGERGGWLPENVNTGHIHPQPALPTVIPQVLLQGHKSPVVDVDWSPDSSTIASLSEDGEVRFWDAHTGELRHSWYIEDMQECDANLRYVCFDVVWGKDSQTLATIYRSQRNEEYATVWLWDAQTEELLAVHEETWVTFSLDRRYMLLIDASDNLMIFDMETHQATSNQPETLFIARSNVFSPDGNPIFPESEQGEINQNLSLRDRMRNFVSFNNSIKTSPDGQYYASVRLILRTDTKEVIARYTGYGVDVAWSPDSTRLAIASAYLVRIWVVPE